ncbi:MAG: S53 family peptidase, partial [Thermacetogeniaceae bacterium]
MRRLLILFFTSLFLLAATSSAWASKEPAFPKGWQVHHPIHIRGGVHKGIHPYSSTGGGGYTPAQIRHAYGIDQLSNNGAGQTIAIIVAYGSPTIQKDLAAFDTENNLPAANLTIAYPKGSPSSNDKSWAEETSLDVEWVHALAPKASILLVVAKSDSGIDLFSAVQSANAQSPQIVSMSWGGSEFSGESSYDTTYFSHSGTLYLTASGDSGAGAQYPAASPNVIAVGGTSLPYDANGNPEPAEETAWSDSGGGISSSEAQPSWQTNFGITGSYRSVPDVAFDADPNTGVNVYFDDSTFRGTAGWLTIGGTSLSVQCWAAIMALADQNSRMTNTSQALYRLAGSKSNFNPDGAYRDITTGSNGGYSAGVGYDLVTGLGSPVANVLVPDLTANPKISVSPSSGAEGANFVVTGSGFTPNSTATSHLTGHNPLSVAIGSSGAYSYSISSTSFTPGTYSNYVVDKSGVSSNTVSFT